MYSARIEDLALRAWAIGARWQLKTQVFFFLFSYTPHLAQGYNGLPCYHAPYSVVIPFHLSQGYNSVSLYAFILSVVIPFHLSQGYNKQSN